MAEVLHNDGVNVLEMDVSDGKVRTRRRAHPRYQRMVRESAEKLRQSGMHRKDVRLALSMTEEDYHRLGILYPAIHRGTLEERRVTWEKIAKAYPQLVAVEFKGKYHGR